MMFFATVHQAFNKSLSGVNLKKNKKERKESTTFAGCMNGVELHSLNPCSLAAKILPSNKFEMHSFLFYSRDLSAY